MDGITLHVKRREATKTARKNRTERDVFGVVYGHEVQSLPVVSEFETLRKTLKTAGTSHLIKLTVDEDAPIDVLLKEVNEHPVTNRIRHFDFYAVKKGEKIDVEIPVLLTGEAPAAKLGHVVHQLIDTIEVKTDPSHIPESIQIDITGLSEVGDTIYLSAVTFDEHVQVEEELLEQAVVKIDAVEELVVEDVTAEASVEDVEAEHGEAGAEGAEAEAEAAAEATPDKKE